MKEVLEYATFGGGCFWCTEAIFQRVKGVKFVIPGFSGGTAINPNYKVVCTGKTGYAEVVQVVYNPEKVSFLDLLNIFFGTHDPTTLNRQGNDIGPHYRSVIFAHDESQKEIANEVIAELTHSKVYENPIVTEVVDFTRFYPAEPYHRDYYNQNQRAGYCNFVIKPKIEKFEKVFRDLIK